MLRQDLSFAFRQFRKSPVFAFTAIVSLMLGIGATTAVFSVVYAILMNPYPFATPTGWRTYGSKTRPETIVG